MVQDRAGDPAAEAEEESIAVLRARALRGEASLSRLRAELEEMRAAAAAVSRDDAVLRRLAETLHWEGAPLALRTVLPLARALRRLHWRIHAPGAAAAGATAASGALHAAAPVPLRRAWPKRVVLRIYRICRPVALPLAIRAHRLLGRLLEKEAIASRREGSSGSAIAPATAGLLQSIEAAMLTLALQRRDGRP